MYRININTKRRTIKVSYTKKPIVIQSYSKRGLIGPVGPKGDDGVGIPSGGVAGQVITKGTGPEEITWTSFAGADKYYIQNFNLADSLIVNHGLNKYPAVTVHDSAGDEVVGEIVHTNNNRLTVVFSAPFSGRITCN